MLKGGSTVLSKKPLILTIGGAAMFWVTTIATSLLPLAADYRAAFTNWKIQTVWVDSLFAGLIIGCGVSYFLLRSLHRMPTRDPVLVSVRIGFVALVIATVLIDAPRSFLTPGSGDTLYFFIVGLMFNATRFLLLGFTTGFLYKRLYGKA